MNAKDVKSSITEKEFAKRFLSVIQSVRDAEKLVEEGIPEAYVEGYEQALRDLAEWLRDEFGITE